MRSWLKSTYAKLRRENDWVVDAAFVLIVVGALLIAFAGNSNWSKVLGGAVLGAGFSIVVATVTGRRAVTRQYAKEANLRRKGQVYGPLHAEVKRVREYFDDVRRGARPYPPRVEAGTPPTQYETPGFTPPPTTWVPSLYWWTMFKSDYRIDDFSESSQRLLDEVNQAAEAYNSAVTSTEEPAIDALASAIEMAIKSMKATAEYKAWLHSEESRKAAPVNHHSPVPQDWLRHLTASTGAPDIELGRTWARSWIKSWPFFYLPATLGWLLAANPAGAARHVHAGYTGPGDPAPPEDWIEQIMQTALDDLRQSTQYNDFHTTSDALLYKLKKAESVLENGLRDIRDRYEGGAPPV